MKPINASAPSNAPHSHSLWFDGAGAAAALAGALGAGAVATGATGGATTAVDAGSGSSARRPGINWLKGNDTDGDVCSQASR
jgi:hypothetical protein